MQKAINSFKNYLDYENNYYFYHETSNKKAQSICDNGLLLSGYNILDVNNLLFTTAAPLTEDLTTNNETFENFLTSEINVPTNRLTDEMVIIAVPKEDIDYVVKPYYSGGSNDEKFFNYIVDPEYILGYFDLENKDFIHNPQSIYFESSYII